MRTPTPSDIKTWATTPILTTSTTSTTEKDNGMAKSVWHRTTTESGAVEVLEGSPREYYLERTKRNGRTFVLIGVSE